jgi:hypothetical protein
MKRTPLKRKTKICKTGKQPISKIQKLLWAECKRIIRARYPNVCYTCGATGLSGRNWHTGHLWAKASLGAYLKYDIRVLRPQCMVCNNHHGGMGADFYKKMLVEIGKNKMSELENDRNVSVKAYDHYVKLLEEYRKIKC